MSTPFQPQQFEADIQALWAEQDAYRVDDHAHDHKGNLKPKYYACSMLPYPSGKLHMGHVRNYTINDMLARYLRMKGYNVLMPMGWDAFGLPAENAALKNKVPPAQWTYDNIAYMKKQMQAMGLSIDWSREVTTCSPDYYRWNQWFFLKMLEKGIAYRKTQVVNWDPVDQTVLANEQVIDGRGWRTGALVEKREIPGYYLHITAYAQELLDHVQMNNPKATLEGWPDKVRLMQENWLGKSEGVRFAFLHDIKDEKGVLIQDGRLYVFTTRADTLMGVTFCAVAPEHPLAAHAAQTNAAVADFIAACQKGGNTEAELALKEKEGVFTGLFVKHPLSGERIPVWVGNYVLMSYGDGAVMGVPAHDERDFAFAQKYSLPIVQVVAPKNPDADQVFSDKKWQAYYAQKDDMVCMGDGPLQELSHQEAIDKVAQLLSEKGLGDKKITWRLRDWGISRQRYWGTPIPIIHCEHCGPVAVPEKDLPVILPENLVPDGSGNPLNQCADFVNVPCPKCERPARRETDTMDTFVDSAWYFMRYTDPHASQAMVAQGAQYWMPMDQYIGGVEHAILHLLYARFWTKVMRDMGLIQIDEPFVKLLTQGMVLNRIYSRRTQKGAKEYFWPHDVEPILNEQGQTIGVQLKNAVQSDDGCLPAGTPVDDEGIGTMSKSKNNGVDPQALIEKYGADTARLYTMFAAPPEATLEWNDAAVDGSFRFLRRVWNFVCLNAASLKLENKAEIKATGPISAKAKHLRRELHTILGQIDYDYERMQYNTVASGCMKMLNALESFEPQDQAGDKGVLQEGCSILLRVLYPLCPHLTYKLWLELAYAKQWGDLLEAPWPQVDAQALEQETLSLILQINGKLKGSIDVPAQADREGVEAIALAHALVQKQMSEKAVKKVIVVSGRLVNVVLE